MLLDMYSDASPVIFDLLIEEYPYQLSVAAAAASAATQCLSTPSGGGHGAQDRAAAIAHAAAQLLCGGTWVELFLQSDGGRLAVDAFCQNAMQVG